jgi:hypothetical protein
MDELIRELRRRAAEAVETRDIYPISAQLWHFNDGLAQAYQNAILEAEGAKRRMSEREPAWDLADDTGPRP